MLSSFFYFSGDVEPLIVGIAGDGPPYLMEGKHHEPYLMEKDIMTLNTNAGTAGATSEETVGPELMGDVLNHLNLEGASITVPGKSGDEGSGDEGSGEEGSGDEGSGDEGSGEEGSGDEGSGDEGSGDEGSGDEGSGDEGSEDDEGKKKLSPQLQEKIDKRIAKEVGKRKELEEKLSTSEEETGSLKEEVTALRSSAGAKATGAHPLFFAENENEFDKREEKLLKFRAWARKNRNGYEGAGTDEDPSYTAEEIQERLEQLEDERQITLPKARTLFKERQAADERIKKVYPDLLDKNSDEYKAMQSKLARFPGLRLLPDYKLAIGDMLIGESFRTKKGKGKGKVPKASKVPSTPGAAAPTQLGGKKKKGKGEPVDVSGYVEAGGTPEALERAVSGLA